METTRTYPSATHELLSLAAKVSKSPSDGSGTFEFVVDAFNTLDKQNEKIANYTNVEPGELAAVPIDYAHVAVFGRGADEMATDIGLAKVHRIGDRLYGRAQLDLDNRVAQMVYERLLLPSSDPAHLGEVSVWLAFDPTKATKADGVRTIYDAELLSVAVVKAGAQATAISRVKNLGDDSSRFEHVGVESYGPMLLRRKGQHVKRVVWADDPTLEGKGLETFAESKARLIKEYGDDARQIFGEPTTAGAKAASAVKARRKVLDAAMRRMAGPEVVGLGEDTGSLAESILARLEAELSKKSDLEHFDDAQRLLPI